MYYNEELKCWVMPGEEAEKRREVEALRAPPVMPGASGAPSAVSGVAGDGGVHSSGNDSATGANAVGSRSSNPLASRYAAMPTMSVREGQSESQQSVLAGLKPPPVGSFGGLGQFRPMQPMQPMQPALASSGGGVGAGHQNVWERQRMKQRGDSKNLESLGEGSREDAGTAVDDARQSLEGRSLHRIPAPAEPGELGGHGGFDGYDANGEQSISHSAEETAMDPFVLEVLSFWSYYRTAGYDVEAMKEWVGDNYGEDVAGELDCEALLMDVLVMEAVEAYKATHMNDDGGHNEPTAVVGGPEQADDTPDHLPRAGRDDEYQAYGGAMGGFGADAEGVGYHGAAEVPPEMGSEMGVEMPPVPTSVGEYGANADYQQQAYQEPGQEYGYETPAGVLSPADHLHHSRPREHNMVHQPAHESGHQYDHQPEEQQVSYVPNALYDQAAEDSAPGGAPGEHQQIPLEEHSLEGYEHAVKRVEEDHGTPTALPSRPTESSNATTPATIKLQAIAMQDHVHMESHLLKVIEGHAATIQSLTAKLEAANEEASSGRVHLEDKDEKLRKLRAELDDLSEIHAKSAAQAAEAEEAAREAAREAAHASQTSFSDLELRLEEARAEMTALEAARSVLETEKEAGEQRATDLENDVLALRGQVDALEEEKAELAQMAERAGRESEAFDQQQQDLENLRIERDELSAETNRLREALAASESAAAANVSESSALESVQIEELTKKLSVLEEEKAAMQDDFQNMLDERDAEIMQLEARVMLSESAVHSAKNEARDELLEETKRQLLEELAGEKEQQSERLCELEALAQAKDAELATAEERIRELERIVGLAKKKILAQTGQVEKLTAERQELLDRGQATGQVDDEAMNELAGENAELKATIDALESRINDAEAIHEQDISNLMKENDQLMDALSQKEDDLEMVVTELAQLRSEAESNLEASEELSRMSDEMKGLREAVTAAEAALQEEQASRETFRTHVEAEELRLYEQIRELEDQISFLKETLGDAEEAARVAKEEAQEARAAAAESEGLHSVEAMHAAVEEATNELTALLDEKAAELAALNESLDVERADRHATEEDLRQQVARLEEQYSFLEESASSAQQALMEERGAKDMSNAQCTELSERMQDMLGKLDQAEQAAQDAFEDARGLREELEQASKASNAREAEIAQLKATLADYESSLLDANETLENAQRDIAELTELVERNGVHGDGGETPEDAHKEELEREISSLKHQLTSLSESASNHQDELRKYKLQLVKAKKLRAADQEKIEELQNSVDELNEAVAVAMSSAVAPRAGSDDQTAELDAINQELESSLTDALTALGQEEAKVVRLMELLNNAGLTEDEIQVELDTVAEQVGFGGFGGDDDNEDLL